MSYFGSDTAASLYLSSPLSGLTKSHAHNTIVIGNPSRISPWSDMHKCAHKEPETPHKANTWICFAVWCEGFFCPLVAPRI